MATPPPIVRNTDRILETNDQDYLKRQMSEDDFNQYGTGGSFDTILSDLATKYRDPKYRFQNKALSEDEKLYLKGMSPEQLAKELGGRGTFGYDYTEALLNDPEYRKQFAKKPGQTQAQWLANLERHFPGMTQVFQNSGWGTNQRFQDFFDYDSRKVGEESAADLAARKEREKKEKLEAEISAFADSLKNPVTADDPEVKSIMTLVGNAAEKRARLQGIQGPISIANEARETTDQLGKYNLQRKSMYSQALGAKTAFELGQAQKKEADAMAAWQRDAGEAAQRAANNPLPTALGIGGAVIGGVAGAFAGNPLAGAGAGFSIGSGAGKMIAGNGYIPPPPSRKYYGSY